jgi:selenocysteine lyase/cysteine desulfurase
MRLRNMTWENGAPMVVISPITSDDEERGHALVMIFLTPSGLLMPHRILENIISARGIAVRTGFFCNPGTSLHIMAPYMDMGKNGLSLELFVNRYIPRMSKMGRLHEMIEKNPHQGYIRVSFGLSTNRADVETFLACIEQDGWSKPQEMEQQTKTFMASCSIPFSISYSSACRGASL